jgi:flagellar basal-body rod modification protein FlgD
MNGVNGAQQASDVLSQYRLQSEEKKSSNDLGKNEFMDLMIAQMENQNPLKPQENGDFIAQLAQFSSLEETQKLSGSVQDMVGEFRSTQALQASAMVGRSVVVPSQSGQLDASGELNGFVNVPASTSNLRVSVTNQSGELVRQLDLGPSQGGQKKFSWDGKDGSGNTMPPGSYKLTAEASYPQGAEQLGTLVSANVDSVSLGKQGGVTLNLGSLGSIGLADVQQIN